ncbi:hypothetical protein CC80DRAFT_576179 [Byssothecium circinans]|uniref:Uncharacterized protein n=1 Tax=Byssothecium circinans TaxID=147558 RepID=A0A6A5TJW4_9PLEO|nr:hypothetical protein CC80DRAFT_576179 [Byssothecium circinans]
MAHQAHVLPWHTIADHFRFVYANKQSNGRTNLYPTFKPGQGKQLQQFAQDFATLINHASTQERRRYPEHLLPPTEDELFIPDTTAKHVAKTVASYKLPDNPSTRQDERAQVLKDEERKLRYWLLHLFEVLYHDYEYPTEIRECVELLKTLVVHGEVEPLLRLVSHPDINLAAIWSFPHIPLSNKCREFGWADVKNCTLMSYLCFNMFLVKPELWDPVARMYDYRRTSAYQKMLSHCTSTRWNDNYDVCTHPHRLFLGIEKGMIAMPSWSHLAKERMGMGPPSSFIDARYRSWYVPTAADVSYMLSVLRTKLPTELALSILEAADYIPKRQVPVPNDPLHADNAEELKKYMDSCWDILVRVDMLLKANGKWIDWEYEVTEVMFELWGVDPPRTSDGHREMSEVLTVHEWAKRTDCRKEGEVDGWRKMRRVFM